MEFKIYVANLGKYNEGKLIGEWINLPFTEREMEELLDRIGINEEYEEIFIADYENEFGYIVNEDDNLDELNEIAYKLDNLTIDEEEKIKAGLELWSFDEVYNYLDDVVLLKDVNNHYDLGYYWIEESGCYNLDKLGNLRNYIDYDAFGRDIDLESHGGFTSYGYIELH